MLKVRIRALKPEETPHRWSQRVHCQSVAFRDMASPYLSGWRESRYGPGSGRHNDHDHSMCRHRAKYEVNGVLVCGRHLNTLCTEIVMAGEPVEVELVDDVRFSVLAFVGMEADVPREHEEPMDMTDWPVTPIEERAGPTGPTGRFNPLPPHGDGQRVED